MTTIWRIARPLTQKCLCTLPKERLTPSTENLMAQRAHARNMVGQATKRFLTIPVCGLDVHTSTKMGNIKFPRQRPVVAYSPGVTVFRCNFHVGRHHQRTVAVGFGRCTTQQRTVHSGMRHCLHSTTSVCTNSGDRSMMTRRWIRIRMPPSPHTPAIHLSLMGLAATAMVWSATHDINRCAEMACITAVVVAFFIQPLRATLRRTQIAKVIARSVHRYCQTSLPHNRRLRSAVLAMNASLTGMNKLRDDIFALRPKLMEHMVSLQVRRVLGDNVQLGSATLMREVRRDGDRMVEAIFAVHGRDNSAWRNGWKEGELHVVADGNCLEAYPVSLMLVVCKEGRLVLKGKGVHLAVQRKDEQAVKEVKRLSEEDGEER